jgi:RNA polymerase sigma factor (sigma-70 family)
MTLKAPPYAKRDCTLLKHYPGRNAQLAKNDPKCALAVGPLRRYKRLYDIGRLGNCRQIEPVHVIQYPAHQGIIDFMPSEFHDPQNEKQRVAFPTTRWSIVMSAGRDSTAEARLALKSLCETYWRPLYEYVRRRVPSQDEAQDLTQEFFLELLEKGYVISAKRERGRFRTFLLTAFRHFLSKQSDKARTLKRGAGRCTLSLDFGTANSRKHIDPADGLTAEQHFEREWAVALLNQTMDRLRTEYEKSGRAKLFEELKKQIVSDPTRPSYSETAQRLGIGEVAARQAVSRLRCRYRKVLHEEIARSVADPCDVDDEIRKLFLALSF